MDGGALWLGQQTDVIPEFPQCRIRILFIFVIILLPLVVNYSQSCSKQVSAVADR